MTDYEKGMADIFTEYYQTMINLLINALNSKDENPTERAEQHGCRKDRKTM